MKHLLSICSALFVFDVTVPANTTATVPVPAKSADAITEGGEPLTKAGGVKFVWRKGDRTALTGTRERPARRTAGSRMRDTDRPNGVRAACAPTNKCR